MSLQHTQTFGWEADLQKKNQNKNKQPINQKDQKPGIPVLLHSLPVTEDELRVLGRCLCQLVLVHVGEIRFLCSPGPGTNSNRSRGESDGKVEAPSPPLPSAHLATQSPPRICSSGEMSPETGIKGEVPSSTQVRLGGGGNTKNLKCKGVCLIKYSPVRSILKDLIPYILICELL